VRGGAAVRPERFRPSDRVRKRFEHRAVRERGRRVGTPHFLILVLPRAGGATRLGITVTKKVSPSAVGRNRVKRLLREVFRRNRERFPAACDVGFVAKDGAPALDYDAVLGEVLGVEQKLRRLAREVRP
jgi:ribonuclease P protein component